MQKVIADFGILNLGDWEVPLRLYGYGMMLVLGFLGGIALAQWRARRAGENPEALMQCGVLAVVGGIAGSRIAYIIQHWDREFARAPNRLAEMLNLTSGGLIYYGGVALAAVLVLGYLWSKKLPVRRYLDFLAVSAMVGLAFGRAGCLLNGCCFGGPTRSDWAMGMRFPMYSRPLLKFDGRENPYSAGDDWLTPVYAHQFARGAVEPDRRLLDSDGRLIPPEDFNAEQVAVASATRSLPVQPAQVLGIVNALLIAAMLGVFHRVRKREGEVFALMLLLYPVTRFVLESIRDSNPHDLSAGLLTHNQYSSIIMAIAGVGMLLGLRKLPASAGPAWARRLAAQTQTATKLTGEYNRNKKRKRIKEPS